MYKVEYKEQSRTYRKRISKNKNTLNRNRYIHVKIHIQLIQLIYYLHIQLIQLLQLIINGCFNQTETSINLIIDAFNHINYIFDILKKQKHIILRKREQ